MSESPSPVAFETCPVCQRPTPLRDVVGQRCHACGAPFVARARASKVGADRTQPARFLRAFWGGTCPIPFPATSALIDVGDRPCLLVLEHFVASPEDGRRAAILVPSMSAARADLSAVDPGDALKAAGFELHQSPFGLIAVGPAPAASEGRTGSEPPAWARMLLAPIVALADALEAGPRAAAAAILRGDDASSPRLNSLARRGLERTTQRNFE